MYELDYNYKDDCLNCSGKKDCLTKTKKKVEINTPVKLKVVTNMKDFKIECGEPEIQNCSKIDCHHNENDCEFLIKQVVCMEIPISYHIKAVTGESYIDCSHD